MKEDYRNKAEDKIQNEFEVYEKNQLKPNLSTFNKISEELTEFKKQ